MNDLQKRVHDYLLNDRQWTRPMRIAHAQYQISSAKTDEDRTFWTEVLKANQ